MRMGLNESAKGMDPDWAGRFVQAGLDQKFVRSVSFLYVRGPHCLVILSTVAQNNSRGFIAKPHSSVGSVPDFRTRGR